MTPAHPSERRPKHRMPGVPADTNFKSRLGSYSMSEPLSCTEQHNKLDGRVGARRCPCKGPALSSPLLREENDGTVEVLNLCWSTPPSATPTSRAITASTKGYVYIMMCTCASKTVMLKKKKRVRWGGRSREDHSSLIHSLILK